MLFLTAACLKAFCGKEEGALCDAKCDKKNTLLLNCLVESKMVKWEWENLC